MSWWIIKVPFLENEMLFPYRHRTECAGIVCNAMVDFDCMAYVGLSFGSSGCCVIDRCCFSYKMWALTIEEDKSNYKKSEAKREHRKSLWESFAFLNRRCSWFECTTTVNVLLICDPDLIQYLELGSPSTSRMIKKNGSKVTLW